MLSLSDAVSNDSLAGLPASGLARSAPSRESVSIQQPRVVIRLVGSFEIAREGTRCPVGGIGGKAKTLLKLLAVERGRMVSLDRIVEVLWQGDPPKRPRENVATLVSRLRRVLGSRAILGGRVGYRLGATPAVSVDIDEAAALVTEAARLLAAAEPAMAAIAASRALQILQDGPALAEEPSAQWAESTRNEAAALLAGPATPRRTRR